MQTPDSEGYINVTWPSKNVPHGGIFHTRIAKPTEKEQQFLKVLLEESKLNLKLRQNQAYGLRSEDRGRSAVSAAASQPPPPPTPTARPRTSRRRSLSAIRSSGVLDVDTFRPLKKGVNREHMKEKLANTMAYGDSPEQQPPAPPLRSRQKPAPKLPSTKETWNDLVTQIRERADWLAEMEYLGHAGPHREIVEEQIAERMRALDALGVDSVCSSARSTARSAQNATVRSTAHSIVHSHSPAHSNVHTPVTEQQGDVHSSARSKITAKKLPSAASGKKPKKPDENVTAYSKMSPLRYSPRRRV